MLTAAVFVLFGLGAKLYVDGHPTGIPGPWWLLGKVPGLGAIPPTRLALVVTACVGVLLAIASDRLPRPDAVSAGLTYHRVWVVAVAVALLPAAPRPLQAEPMLNATPRSTHFFRRSLRIRSSFAPARRLHAFAMRWLA